MGQVRDMTDIEMLEEALKYIKHEENRKRILKKIEKLKSERLF